MAMWEYDDGGIDWLARNQARGRGIRNAELAEGSKLCRSRNIKSSDEIAGLPDELRSKFLRNIVDGPYGFSLEQREWLIANSTAAHMLTAHRCYFEDETDLLTFLLKFK